MPYDASAKVRRLPLAVFSAVRVRLVFHLGLDAKPL
jgi:hypothetical protein